MGRRFRLAVVVLTVLVAVGVGVLSYNAGLAHGLAVNASQPGAPAGAFVRDGWYHPWGFGLFAPFLFIFLWFTLLRSFCWGGFYGRRWRRYGPGDDAAEFEEWHRRAHDRMKT